MKKAILLFSCGLVGSLTLLAQPTITSSSYAGVGSSVTLTEATAFELDTTKGANVTWDFSALVPESPQDFDPRTITYILPSSSPFASTFPTANICYREQEGTTIRYSYFVKTPTKLERIGSAENTSATNIYSNPQTEMVFPFTYGVTSSDEWSNTQSSFGGTTDLEGIGYGTLNLPNNRVYNNVQLMRVTVDELIPILVYYWLNENGEVLAYYTPGDGLFIPLSVRYATAINSVSVNEFTQSVLTVSYDNPVINNCKLKLPKEHSELTYTVTNILGQVMATGTIQQDEQNITLEMGDYKAGIYYLTAMSATERIEPITLLKQ
ncbi:MAG: T9SS type A sorting domain-containing protein [Bacteroidia bacterium]|jgi:hypothetical protein|nr:T9SS type A sorting domain-containing protein [Bacteroidia bacterium]